MEAERACTAGRAAPVAKLALPAGAAAIAATRQADSRTFNLTLRRCTLSITSGSSLAGPETTGPVPILDPRHMQGGGDPSTKDGQPRQPLCRHRRPGARDRRELRAPGSPLPCAVSLRLRAVAPAAGTARRRAPRAARPYGPKVPPRPPVCVTQHPSAHEDPDRRRGA
jgi:hypothetical protein